MGGKHRYGSTRLAAVAKASEISRDVLIDGCAYAAFRRRVIKAQPEAHGLCLLNPSVTMIGSVWQGSGQMAQTVEGASALSMVVSSLRISPISRSVLPKVSPVRGRTRESRHRAPSRTRFMSRCPGRQNTTTTVPEVFLHDR